MPIEKKSSKEFEEAIQSSSYKKDGSVLGKFLKNNILKIVIGIIVFIALILWAVSNNKYKNTDEYKYQQAHNIYDIVDYNDAIIDTFDYINEATDVYFDTEYTDSAEELRDCYNIVSLYGSGLNFLKNIGGWKNDRTFIDPAIVYGEKYMAFYQSFCDTLKQKDDLSDDEYIEKYTSLLSMSDEINTLFDNVKSAQDSFAEKYDYEYKTDSVYYSYFSNIYDEYTDKDNYFRDNEEDWSTSKIIKEIDNLINYDKDLLEQAKNPPVRTGDKSIQTAMINLLNENISYYEKFGYIMENISDLSDNEYDSLKEEIGEIEERLDELDDKFSDAQKKFRALYDS